MADPLLLYELCVQSVSHAAPLLRAIHGGGPKVLGEDFAGSGALSREWVRTDPEARAIAVDQDGEALARCTGVDRVTTLCADVRDTDPAEHACDVLFVGNFSIGYLHTRAELVAYLKHARARLSAPSPLGGEGGRRSRPGEGSTQVPSGKSPVPVFICDTYGGESSFIIGEVHRYHPVPPERADELGCKPGDRVRYTWEQRDADPLTGMVTNALHFRIERAGTVLHELNDAFVYRWRLWSVPELRDAMLDAGFESTAVYAQLPDAVDSDGNAHIEPTSAEDLDDSFIVCVAGVV